MSLDNSCLNNVIIETISHPRELVATRIMLTKSEKDSLMRIGWIITTSISSSLSSGPQAATTSIFCATAAVGLGAKVGDEWSNGKLLRGSAEAAARLRTCSLERQLRWFSITVCSKRELYSLVRQKLEGMKANTGWRKSDKMLMMCPYQNKTWVGIAEASGMSCDILYKGEWPTGVHQQVVVINPASWNVQTIVHLCDEYIRRSIRAAVFIPIESFPGMKTMQLFPILYRFCDFEFPDPALFAHEMGGASIFSLDGKIVVQPGSIDSTNWLLNRMAASGATITDAAAKIAGFKMSSMFLDGQQALVGGRAK